MVNIRLRQLLTKRGISQSELAKMTGIRPSTICELYNQNAAFVKLENLYKICRALNCSVSDFFEFPDE